jgi:hypothetical protein
MNDRCIMDNFLDGDNGVDDLVGVGLFLNDRLNMFVNVVMNMFVDRRSEVGDSSLSLADDLRALVLQE